MPARAGRFGPETSCFQEAALCPSDSPIVGALRAEASFDRGGARLRFEANGAPAVARHGGVPVTPGTLEPGGPSKLLVLRPLVRCAMPQE